MKILKFEKFFKNDDGPRISARNTALNDNTQGKQRYQLTSVSNLQNRKKIMSSTTRVQKKVNYNSNLHPNIDEPVYDSIQSNLPQNLNQDQKSRQS